MIGAAGVDEDTLLNIVLEAGAEDMRRKAKRIQSVKGLGKVSASTSLAVLPETGGLSRQGVAGISTSSGPEIFPMVGNSKLL